MKDANIEALNKYLAKQQSGEEQLEEGQDLIECRLSDGVIPELQELIKEVEGLDYGLNGKELVIDYLINAL